MGAVARHVTNLVAARWLGTGFPWGTLLVNAVGCFAFGVLANMVMNRPGDASALRSFLLVGLLGGFTTYSSFAFETVALMRTGQPGTAVLNIGGQLAVGLAAVWLGLRLTT